LDAVSLYNPEGSGLGIFFRKKGTRVFAFPGIPSEYMAMAEKEILSTLVHQGYWTRIHVTGWAESILKDKLEQFTSNRDLHISILPSVNLIEIVLRGEENTVRTAETKIRTDLAEDVLPHGILSLPEALFSEALRSFNTFSFAESCTGGLLGATLTDIAGVSAVFRGSAVCYSNESKNSILNVPQEVISVHGAVSEECALAMAQGARERFLTDYSLSVTGIAGPDGGSRDKPVGTVWIGVCSSGKARAEEFLFSGTREMIRKRALFKGVEILWRCIKGDDSWI
ncbi:MAG: nicotinamide-nucleotide amidohydrolase family protein, partial [Synergistales bacterium]|nr:nicotinamide-nucleotide amidohydrolase family protein [Synergistales bacterium]